MRICWRKGTAPFFANLPFYWWWNDSGYSKLGYRGRKLTFLRFSFQVFFKFPPFNVVFLEPLSIGTKRS